jgi:hypothetical protein
VLRPSSRPYYRHRARRTDLHSGQTSSSAALPEEHRAADDDRVDVDTETLTDRLALALRARVRVRLSWWS